MSDRSFSNLSVRQILNELVRIDPGYQWKIYNGGHVVFEPCTEKNGGKEKSVLDKIVSILADNVPLDTLLSQYDHPFGRELGYTHGLCSYQLVWGKNPEFNNILISVHLENITLRDALNAIVTEAEKATGDRFRWVIKGFKRDGIDIYGNTITGRGFTFQRISKEWLKYRIAD